MEIDNAAADQETESTVPNNGNESPATEQSADTPPGSEPVGETGSNWEAEFDGKTPAEVKAEIESWKSHARKWEKRAQTTKRQSEKDDNAHVEQLENLLAEVEAERVMFRDLIALEIDSGKPVPISALADSIAFRDAYRGLDRDSRQFPDELAELVQRRSRNRPAAGIEVETARASSGSDLYERMFGEKK